MTPKSKHPIFDFQVPSTKEIIKYRPFLTGEKKLLLIALESNDDTEIGKAVRQILKNCIIDGADVDKLASFDIELFFLHLRSKSDSEIIEASFRCDIEVDGNPCNHLLEIRYNLLDTQVTEHEGHTKKIMLSANTGIMMKYPTLEILDGFTKWKTEMSNIEATFKFILECVDYLFDAEQIYKPEDMAPGELEEYVNNLTTAEFQKLESFIETMPSVKSTIEKKCEKCGFEHQIAMEGLASFFE